MRPELLNAAAGHLAPARLKNGPRPGPATGAMPADCAPATVEDAGPLPSAPPGPGRHPSQ